MPATLSVKTYQDLVKKITAIYTQANREVQDTIGRIRTRACWEIGIHIEHMLRLLRVD